MLQPKNNDLLCLQLLIDCTDCFPAETYILSSHSCQLLSAFRQIYQRNDSLVILPIDIHLKCLTNSICPLVHFFSKEIAKRYELKITCRKLTQKRDISC